MGAAELLTDRAGRALTVPVLVPVLVHPAGLLVLPQPAWRTLPNLFQPFPTLPGRGLRIPLQPRPSPAPERLLPLGIPGVSIAPGGESRRARSPPRPARQSCPALPRGAEGPESPRIPPRKRFRAVLRFPRFYYLREPDRTRKRHNLLKELPARRGCGRKAQRERRVPVRGAETRGKKTKKPQRK